MNVKHFLKQVSALALCALFMVPSTLMAGEAADQLNSVSVADYGQYLESNASVHFQASGEADQQLSEEALDYFKKAMGSNALNDLLAKYCEGTPSKEKAYEMFRNSLNTTYQEAEANGFSVTQAAQLLRSAADLETGHAKVTAFTPANSDTLPLPHWDSDDTLGTVDINGLKLSANNTDISVKSNQLEAQTLPFPVYVNGLPVTIQNAILYNDHTYVQLRELANVTNMGVDFVDTDMSPLPIPDGNLPTGINIDQPTFVYTKDNVPDWVYHDGDPVEKAVDITTLHHSYYYLEADQVPANVKYYFLEGEDSGEYFIAVDQDGNTVKKQVHAFTSMGKVYVSVDEFRSIIQPYLVDMCMQ